MLGTTWPGIRSAPELGKLRQRERRHNSVEAVAAEAAGCPVPRPGMCSLWERQLQSLRLLGAAPGTRPACARSQARLWERAQAVPMPRSRGHTRWEKLLPSPPPRAALPQLAANNQPHSEPAAPASTEGTEPEARAAARPRELPRSRLQEVRLLLPEGSQGQEEGSRPQELHWPPGQQLARSWALRLHRGSRRPRDGSSAGGR